MTNLKYSMNGRKDAIHRAPINIKSASIFARQIALAMAGGAALPRADTAPAQNLCRIYDALESLALWLRLAIYSEPYIHARVSFKRCTCFCHRFSWAVYSRLFGLKIWGGAMMSQGLMHAALALLAVALPLLLAWLLVCLTDRQEERISSPEGRGKNEDI